MEKIKDIYDLQKVANHEWHKLSCINEEYLSEAGKAAMEAYQVLCWYACAEETLTDLINNKDFLDLLLVKGKHSEYYHVLRMARWAINRIVG